MEKIDEKPKIRMSDHIRIRDPKENKDIVNKRQTSVKPIQNDIEDSNGKY